MMSYIYGPVPSRRFRNLGEVKGTDAMTTPDSDFARLHTVLLRQGEPDRIPFYELFTDKEIIEAMLEQALPDLGTVEGREREEYWKAVIQFYYQLGYDYAPVGTQLDLPRDNILLGEDTAELTRLRRGWQDEHHSIIETRQDFQRYPWPEPCHVDVSDIELVAQNLPRGMKVIGQTSGVLENVMWLMGYEPFSLALHDDPELVRNMFERIDTLLVTAHRKMAEVKGVGALCLGDDIGFKTATMIAPELLHQYVFPPSRKEL